MYFRSICLYSILPETLAIIIWKMNVIRSPRLDKMPIWKYFFIINCWLYRRGKIIGTVTVAASLRAWKREAEKRIFLFMISFHQAQSNKHPYISFCLTFTKQRPVPNLIYTAFKRFIKIISILFLVYYPNKLIGVPNTFTVSIKISPDSIHVFAEEFFLKTVFFYV